MADGRHPEQTRPTARTPPRAATLANRLLSRVCEVRGLVWSKQVASEPSCATSGFRTRRTAPAGPRRPLGHGFPVGRGYPPEPGRGATPDTKEPSYWSPEACAWTTPKDLSGLPAPVLLGTERRLSAKGLAKIGSGLLPSGTLLLSSRAPIGYLAIAHIPVAINQGYIAMPPGGQLV